MPGPVYFLLHVPKTAGQTINRHLQQHAPRTFLNVDTSAGRGALGADTSQTRVVSGHGLAQRMEAAFPNRELRRIVLLREPISQQLSLYNFRMLSYRAKGLGTYTFDLHLKTQPRNFTAQFLLANWLGMSALQRARMTDAEILARLNAELARFWFVGAHTDCPRLLEAIAAELGVPGDAPPRNTESEWREQVAWEPLRAENLTAAQRTRIAADHPVDQALWETWREAHFSIESVRPTALADASRPGLARAALFEMVRLAVREISAPGQAARVARADRARERRDWIRAAELYRKSLQWAPRSAALWMQYACALHYSGRLAEAATAYRHVLDLKPDFETARAALASLPA